jgi:hypothetical protein
MTARVLLILLLLLPACPSWAGWTVLLDDLDLTSAASPLPGGTVPAVNISALAPTLKMQASATGDSVTITSPTGVSWHGLPGATTLDTDLDTIALSQPIVTRNGVAFVPLDAVARIAGLELQVSSAEERAVLHAPTSASAASAAEPAPATSEGGLEGWEELVLEKPPSSPSTSPRSVDPDLGLAAEPDSLPSKYDTLRMVATLSQRGGGAAQLDLFGSGRAWGTQVDVSALFDMSLTSARGASLAMPSHRLLIQDQETGRGLEGGDIISSVRGLAEGLRYLWRVGEPCQRSVSLYLPTDDPRRPLPLAVGYEGEVAVGSRVRCGGEVATDGTAMLWGRLNAGRGTLYAHARRTLWSELDGSGVSGSLTLGRGTSLYGSYTRTGAGDNRSDWRSISARIPVNDHLDLTVEQADAHSQVLESTYRSIGVALPVRDVRLRARYLERTTMQTGVQDARPLQSEELVLSLSATPIAHLLLDYQARLVRSASGDGETRQQLVASYWASPGTQIQAVAALPRFWSLDDLRLRVDRKIGDDSTLMLSAYGSEVRLSYRRAWGVRTPGRGAMVSGQVTDQLNRPLPGVRVMLGNEYWKTTDRDGRYSFSYVPTGGYDLQLDARSLPVDYHAATAPVRVKVTSRSQLSVDLHVVPLNAISGRVYCDANGNEEYDEGEGVPGVALMLDGFPTATGDGGAYGFYNLEPGAKSIALLADRLPAEYAPASPTTVTVDLQPDRSASGADFRLQKVTKQLVIETLGEDQTW